MSKNVTSGNGSDGVVCPACGRDDFSSERGLKIHRTKTHGEKEYRDETTLRELYKDKQLSIGEIAEELDSDRSVIWYWLEKHGIERRGFDAYADDRPDELLNGDFLQGLYHGQELSTREIAERIGCSGRTVSRYLHEHGIEARENYWKIGRPGEDNPAWEGGHQHGYGYNWEAQRAKARKRDGYQCRRCGMTQTEHVEETNLRLHVHHIEKKANFINEDGEFDPDEANRLDNLITLCSRCHHRLEGVPIDVR